MTLDTWDGYEEFLSGDKETEWLHYVSNETQDYMYDHWQNQYEILYKEDEV